MKKMLSLAIALALCFSLCACGGNAPQGKSALDWDAMLEELQASSEVLTAQLTNFAFYSGYPGELRLSVGGPAGPSFYFKYGNVHGGGEIPVP